MDKTTKRGYIIVLTLLAIALLLRLSVPYWKKDKWPSDISPELQQRIEQMPKGEINNINEVVPSTSALKPFTFDPNTVTESELIEMNLPHKTVQQFINWRSKGKIFRSAEDFQALYALTEEEYVQLQPFIKINPVYQRSTIDNVDKHEWERPHVPTTIDINSTNAGTLELLWGIGPAAAQAIIERREALGGFYTLNQLKESWRFKDTIWSILEKVIVIDADKIERLQINKAEESTLAQHPYIGEKMAKNIVLYRLGIGKFESINQLRQVPLMDEEKYRKIAPYFTVD